jgi:hypothetical protein
MTIIIHAGLKKCGSSSIHSFLSANREILRNFKVNYPGPGRPATNLANEVQGRKKFNPLGGTLADLVEYRSRAPDETLVLSSEMLEETESEGARHIKSAFLERYPQEKFIIILIVRDLIGLVPSVYAQKTKDGRVLVDFDEFFSAILQDRRVHYFQTAKRWADVFGWESLRVRVLDRAHLINHDLLDDFLSLLGLDAYSATELNRPNITNASPGWRVLESVRALCNGTHGLSERHPLIRAISRAPARRGLGRIASIVAKKNGWNEDRGNYLTRSQTLTCLEIYRSNVETLNRHLPHRLPVPSELEAEGFREREFLPDSTLIAPGELHAFYDDLWRKMSKMRAKQHKRKVDERMSFAGSLETG